MHKILVLQDIPEYARGELTLKKLLEIVGKEIPGVACERIKIIGTHVDDSVLIGHWPEKTGKK